MVLTNRYILKKYSFRLPLGKSLATILMFCAIICGKETASAQIIWGGLKVGGQLNLQKIADPHFRDTVKNIPSPGYSVGATLLFKVKNRYFLHTEYVYTMKSKINKGKIDPQLLDKTVYHYVEIPILFTMQFKVRLGKEKNFKWYAGVGPNIAYLLNGKGVVQSSELAENNISSLSYKINFGDRPQYDRHIDQVYYNSLNRFQFGLNFGAGILLEPANHKIIIDLRYTVDQTLFGKRNADYLVPDDYSDNLKFRNRSLKFSVAYLLEYNISKKERHKGKTTLKPKTKR